MKTLKFDGIKYHATRLPYIFYGDFGDKCWRFIYADRLLGDGHTDPNRDTTVGNIHPTKESLLSELNEYLTGWE